MQLGWIDFSKTERNKVINVLNMLSEKGTLDELGIAPVRDGYSDLFFPGTSTIQTRAKYFLLIPYIMKDLERSGESNPGRFIAALDSKERICAETFLTNNSNENGVIGSLAISQKKWVKRAPSSIYWAGIRRYGIFTGGNLSIWEYARIVSAANLQKTDLKNLGNRNDNAEENERDDKDAGDVSKQQFWYIPLYDKDWFKSLSMKLTQDEASFLKDQIIRSCPDSMMACILENDMRQLLDLESFDDIEASGLINEFSDNIRNHYYHAKSFSEFNSILSAAYNMLVSEGKNEKAVKMLQPDIKEASNIDIEYILRTLNIRDGKLKSFLYDSKECMSKNDIDGLKNIIKRREIWLKGQSRAKTANPGQYGNDAWYGLSKLDYRFNSAKRILQDIFEGIEK